MRTYLLLPILGLACSLASCRIVEDEPEAADEIALEADTDDAAPMWRIAPPPSLDEIEAARRDTSWRAILSPDTGARAGERAPGSVAPGADSAAPDSAPGGERAPGEPAGSERYEDIGPADPAAASGGEVPDAPSAARAAAGSPPRLALPLGGRAEGPSALRAQALLDLALFSPGVVDGRWNANAERALFWFQRREGLPATGTLDAATLDRLWQAAGRPSALVGKRVLTAEDVAGPFVALPDDVYEKADLGCLCYESLEEKLAELAHTTPELLRRLNPGRALGDLAAGDSIRVPLVGRFAGPSTRADPAAGDRRVARLVISDRGRYLQAHDAAGRILFHLPATLGSDYFPSPDGSLRVTSVSPDPWFHYQPALLEGVDPDESAARLAPGPNSPVGVVWIALSKEHYGIHGTSDPETIGFVTSSGCVRLTNWDARLAAEFVAAGTPVDFRDVERAGPG